MEQEQRHQLKKYIDLFLRRKNLIFCCLLLAIVAGLAKYAKTSKVYQASSLLIYQRQSINPTRMSPDVKTRTREMISTLTQQVTSRTSLEKIITKINLYPGLRENIPMEDVVVTMRGKHIKIRQDDKSDTFQVTYQGSDPKKVMLATNALASQFIEENLRFREKRASETSTYVKDELNMAQKALDKKEAVMRDYKLKYYNEMPHQLEVNIGRLNALQAQQQNNQNSIQDLERTKVMIQEQISVRKNMIAEALQRSRHLAEDSAGQVVVGLLLDENAQKLDELNRAKAQLESLLIRYTDQHPEVRRTKRLVEKLKQELAVSDGDTPQEGQQGRTATQTLPGDQQLEQLSLQLDEIEYNIVKLKENTATLSSQIEKYQQWAAAAPHREAEWSALTRDYAQLQKHYQGLVTKNLDAESAETLERRQKGSQFKIIDPARFPETPFHPDFMKIMLLAAAIGLGLGGGLAFVMDQLDDSFKEAADIESYLGLSVTCSIPLVLTKTEVTRKKVIGLLWTAAIIISSIGILGSMLYLWKKGIIIL